MNTGIIDTDLTFDPLILALKQRRSQIKGLEQEIDELREEWDERVRLHGKYTSAAGEISIKRPYQIVSYDSGVVSVVAATLEDISPALAAQLEGAKKIRLVGETWSVR